MCRNDLHITIECPPVESGPDVCDMVTEFITRLQQTEHTTLVVNLNQVEDPK